MARKRKDAEKPENSLTPADMIALLAMHHAQAVTISKTIQTGFSALVTAMGARPDVSLYPDPTAVFMEAFDSLVGDPDEDEPVPEIDEGATTGS